MSAPSPSEKAVVLGIRRARRCDRPARDVDPDAGRGREAASRSPEPQPMSSTRWPGGTRCGRCASGSRGVVDRVAGHEASIPAWSSSSSRSAPPRGSDRRLPAQGRIAHAKANLTQHPAAHPQQHISFLALPGAGTGTDRRPRSALTSGTGPIRSAARSGAGSPAGRRASEQSDDASLLVDRLRRVPLRYRRVVPSRCAERPASAPHRSAAPRTARAPGPRAAPPPASPGPCGALRGGARRAVAISATCRASST